MSERWKARGIKTWYYTTNLHKGAFMLPKYVEDMLEEEEGRKVNGRCGTERTLTGQSAERSVIRWQNDSRII